MFVTIKPPKIYSFGEISDSALIEWTKLSVSIIVNISYLIIFIIWIGASMILMYKGMFLWAVLCFFGPIVIMKIFFHRNQGMLS